MLFSVLTKISVRDFVLSFAAHRISSPFLSFSPQIQKIERIPLYSIENIALSLSNFNLYYSICTYNKGLEWKRTLFEIISKADFIDIFIIYRVRKVNSFS